MIQKKTWLPYLVLFTGVLIVASAAIMIRFTQQFGVSSPTIAAGRLGIAAIILLPIALTRLGPELRTLQKRDVFLSCTAGIFLALHFSAWITSLELTSIASSTALVATNPLWVALASIFLFREHLTPPMLIGVAITIAGSALIGVSDSSHTVAPAALFGDLLALAGAVTGSAYFLIGRELRRRLSIFTYIWIVYTSAALILLIIAIGAEGVAGLQRSLHYPVEVYLLLVGLAVGPQLLGHTAFNWALGYLSATFIVITILGEPVGSALLAWVIFDEQFTPLQLIGFVVLLAGIATTAYAETRRARAGSPGGK